MSHGLLGFKDWAFFPWLAETFAAAGFPALRFNFSGSGMGPHSDGPFQETSAFEADTISRQVEDLRSVLAAVVRGDLAPDLPACPGVFLWGHSRGGGVSILSAAGQPKVHGIAAWASISRVNRYFYEVKQAWRLQGFSAVESSRTGQLLKSGIGFLDDAEAWGKKGDIPFLLGHLKAPLLLVHGAEDTSVPPEESESLAALYPRSRLLLLAGANHKFNASHPWTVPSAVLSEAARKTVEFFESLRT
jgi:pimeloyl-ACP methyl ester carboxylesterase